MLLNRPIALVAILTPAKTQIAHRRPGDFMGGGEKFRGSDLCP
ncbi:MAG: hypothetical protein ABSB32_13405 [Thermodesulfobacteriota bacterium]